jgi:hypothetical protein
VKDRRIGVWISVALAILVLSAWLGSKLGARAAVYRYRSAQSRSLGTLSAPEHAHLESVLDELEAIGYLRLIFLISLNDDKPKVPLPDQLRKIEAFGGKTNTVEAKPVADMNLALADVVAAMAEARRNNKDRATTDIRSAEALYRSLGWRDTSEETLRAFAQHELEKWMPNSQKRENTK